MDVTEDRRLVLRELAHAWAESAPNATTKTRFLEERRLAVWIHDKYPPSSWGAEHAAEIVSWGPMDEPAGSRLLPELPPQELASAFELLTGVSPLVPGG